MEKYPKKRAYAHPELRKFLKKKGVYDKFVENCKNCKRGGRFFKRIDAAFFWSHTPEGVTFWANLNKEHYEQT